MFEKMVVSGAGEARAGRTGYFFGSSIALCVVLITGLVISLFSAELSLGSDDLALVELLAPVEQPAVEPEPPAPAEEQKTVVKQAAVDKMPTRQVNMTRVDETPVAVPKQVSTVQNNQKARPADRYFKIGSLDTDVASGQTSGRNSGEMNGSGPGLGLSPGEETIAGVKEPEAPPPPVIKAPPPVKKTPPVQSLGVINGKASSLPKPRYPAAAKAVHAQGKVSIKVLIDEKGHVVSADAVSGHPLLRDAAEAAAREARFTPTLLSGTPVKVSGTIVYDFSI